MALTLIDSLSTLAVIGNSTEFEKGVWWLVERVSLYLLVLYLLLLAHLCDVSARLNDIFQIYNTRIMVVIHFSYGPLRAPHHPRPFVSFVFLHGHVTCKSMHLTRVEFIQEHTCRCNFASVKCCILGNVSGPVLAIQQA